MAEGAYFNPGVVANNTPGGFSMPAGANSSPPINWQGAVDNALGTAFPSAPDARTLPGGGVGLTQEALDYAINQYLQNMAGVNEQIKAGSSAGGVGITGGGKITAKQAKAESNPQAFAAFRKSQGATDEQIQKEIAKIQKTTAKFSEIPGYKKWLKTNGPQFGLSVIDGKITGKEGVQAPVIASSTDPLKQNTVAYNEQVLGALNQLLPGYAQNIQQQMDYQNQLRGMTSEALQTDAEGLSPSDYADLQVQEDAAKARWGDFYKDKVANTSNYLRNTGFASSNLANNVMNSSAYKPAADYALQLQAQLATQEEQKKQQVAARKAQRIQNILGVGSGFAGGNLTGLTSNVLSPDAYGGWTDPNAYTAAADQMKYAADTQKEAAKNVLSAGISPTMAPPPGTNLGGGIGSLIGAGIGTLIAPGVGTGIGASIGGAAGGMVGR